MTIYYVENEAGKRQYFSRRDQAEKYAEEHKPLQNIRLEMRGDEFGYVSYDPRTNLIVRETRRRSAGQKNVEIQPAVVSSQTGQVIQESRVVSPGSQATSEYQTTTLNDVQRQAKLLELEQREQTGKSSVIYDIIDGQRVPVQVGGTPTFYVTVNGETMSYQDYRRRLYDEKMSNLTYDQMARQNFGRTFNTEMTRADIENLQRLTWGESVDQDLKVFTVRPGHPEDIPGATVGKIGTWGIKTLTGFETMFEKATRPETWKASSIVVGSGAVGMALKDVAVETIDYAMKNPGEFVGQTATSLALTVGVSKGLSKSYNVFRTKAGPSIAKFTRGKIWGSQTKTFKTFTPTEYQSGGRVTVSRGPGQAQLSVTRDMGFRGNAVFKLDQFKRMVEGPAMKIQAYLNQKIRGINLRQIRGTTGTSKRTLYTYIKPKKGVYSYEFKIGTRTMGTGPKHLKLYNIDEQLALNRRVYGMIDLKERVVYMNRPGSVVWESPGHSYGKTLYHEVLHSEFPHLEEQSIRMLTGKTYGTARASFHMNKYTFSETYLKDVVVKKTGGHVGYIRKYNPIPKDVKIPVEGYRYIKLSSGKDFKSVEIGGYDDMIKAVQKPRVSDFKPKPIGKIYKGSSGGGPYTDLDVRQYSMSGIQEQMTSSGSLKTAIESETMLLSKSITSKPVVLDVLTKTKTGYLPGIVYSSPDMDVKTKTGLSMKMRIDTKTDFMKQSDLDVKKVYDTMSMKTDQMFKVAQLTASKSKISETQIFKQIVEPKQKMASIFTAPAITTTSKKRPFAGGISPKDDREFRRMMKKMGIEKKGVKINPISDLTWGPKKRRVKRR